MHAGIETLFIFLAFIVISALSSWLQRRREGQAEEPWPAEPAPGSLEPPQPRRTQPQVSPAQEQPSAAPRSSWEQELRRILEGVRPSPPEPPSHPPVPAVTAGPPRTRPAPPPLVSPPSPVTTTSAIEDSTWAYRQARARQAEAAVRLREAKALTARQLQGLAGRQTDIADGDLTAARRLLSNPRSTRQAIIASTILAAPKALQ